MDYQFWLTLFAGIVIGFFLFPLIKLALDVWRELG